MDRRVWRGRISQSGGRNGCEKNSFLGSVQSEVTLAASAQLLCSILYGFHPSYGADGHS